MEPAPEDGTDHSNSPASTVESLRERLGGYTERAGTIFEEYRSRRPVLDLGVALYERDRDAFASVLGSAIALRLFLFVVPALTAFVGLVNVIGGGWIISSLVRASGTAGKVALDINTATTQSQQSGLGLFLSSLVLLLWAGRSLTRVLAASAAGGWVLSAREAKPTLRMAGTLTGLIFTLLIAAGALARIRRLGGLALSTGSFFALAVVIAIAWFAVMWSLPSGTRDPGALLPGAVFLGGSMAVLQWFMQYYLPDRISESSATLGSIGLAVGALGYFFFVGRLMATSFVVNAVIWERYGSVSEAVFALPMLRRIPQKFPKVKHFFNLGGDIPVDGTDLSTNET